MTRKALLALMLIGLTQNGYCGWQDVLKAVADKALEQQRPSEPKASSSVSPQEKAIEQPNSLQSQDAAGSQQQPGQPKAANHDVDMSIFRINPDDPLSKQGVWKDPRNGLIWSRCPIGQTWDGSGCSGKPLGIKYWDDAFVAASNFKIGKLSNWRIPTVDEVNSIRNCGGRGFKPETYDFLPEDGVVSRVYKECRKSEDQDYVSVEIGGEATFPRAGEMRVAYLIGWLANSSQKETFNFAFDQGKIDVKRYESSYPNAYYAWVVTGGNVPNDYSAKLAAAREKNSQRRGANNAKEQKEKQAELDRQSKIAANQQKMKEFQRTLKPGVRAYQGLVLEVKGDLVKIQAYGKRCYGGAGTSVYDCNPAYIVPDPTKTVGEQWIRRDEISPAQ